VGIVVVVGDGAVGRLPRRGGGGGGGGVGREREEVRRGLV
jgi:hypothetical protein